MQSQVKRIRDLFTPLRRVHYLIWQVLGRRWAVTLRLREGSVVIVRAAPSTDFWVFVQVFLTREYQSPLPLPGGKVHRILDLGANVGFTLVYLAREFPDAEIIAYEPVASHCAQVRAQLHLNRLTERVTLRKAAVGTKSETAYICDRGSDSTICLEPEDGAEQIAIVDLFEEDGVKSVDMLKMDIEGGEYDLIGDERFAQLRILYVVLEWHEWKDRPEQTKEWLVERLQGYGYTVRDSGPAQKVGEGLRVGMLWARMN